eukprot:7354380-Alexandrium_andersonii.AAC.1
MSASLVGSEMCIRDRDKRGRNPVLLWGALGPECNAEFTALLVLFRVLRWNLHARLQRSLPVAAALASAEGARFLALAGWTH